jgi:hypothetical protein
MRDNQKLNGTPTRGATQGTLTMRIAAPNTKAAIAARRMPLRPVARPIEWRVAELARTVNPLALRTAEVTVLLSHRAEPWICNAGATR